MRARLARLGIVCTALAAVSGLAGCDLFRERYGLTRLEAPPRLPEPRTSYLDLGRQLLRARDFDLAKEAFIRSIRVEGITAPALTGAGLAAERQGLLGEAQRYFERALVHAPDSVLAYNNLGAALYRQGKYAEARRAFQAAFALSSGESRIARHNLALSDLALGRELSGTVPVTSNPVPIRREGTGVYTLLAPGERAAEDGAAAPDPRAPAEAADDPQAAAKTDG